MQTELCHRQMFIGKQYVDALLEIQQRGLLPVAQCVGLVLAGQQRWDFRIATRNHGNKTGVF
ncbi:MAG: hypothetical protein ACKN9T_01560 [Candidatus Methylumidiphilus sp.]